ncbi:MAG: hypothetical protein AB1942_20105 [Pseudomonadota bacterium]
MLVIGAPEIGWNFFAELVGVLLTVLVIDRLMREAGEAQLKPVRHMAYSEAEAIARQCRQLLREAIECTVSASDLDQLEAGWDVDAAATLMQRLNFDASSPTMVPVNGNLVWLPWRKSLHFTFSDSLRRVAQFIPRYVAFVDPGIVTALRAIEINPIIRTIGGSANVFQWLQASHWTLIIRDVERLEDELEAMSRRYKLDLAYERRPLIDTALFEQVRAGHLPHPTAQQTIPLGLPNGFGPARRTPSNGATGP